MLKNSILITLLLGSVGCGGAEPADAYSEEDTGEPIPDALVIDGGTPDFSAVGEALEQAVADNTIQGGFAFLDIYSVDTGELLYSATEGDRERTDLLAVASASKWVSSTLLLTLVQDGILNLDSTTQELLGPSWRSVIGGITLEQLLGFTSGLKDTRCSSSADLATCVDTIREAGLEAFPDRSFHYHSSHLQVAAAMAEAATGKRWDALFRSRIALPLGFDPETRYYSSPRRLRGTTNPLIAGGLVISTHDYRKFLGALIGDGSLLSHNLLIQQHTERWARTTKVTGTPIAELHYGLGCWRHCSTPSYQNACDQDLVVHSAGAFGFVPFWDKGNRYYGVLGAENDQGGGGVDNALFFFNELRPLIVAALDGSPTE